MIRSFLRDNRALVISVFGFAWSLLWTVTGSGWSADWHLFMTGFFAGMITVLGTDAIEWYRTRRFLENVLADIRQRAADIEWDNEFEPTAEEIANMETEQDNK